jgi:hypothetical protein
MSDFKISGACTCCDELCFEVLARWSENERYPGEPKRLGPPYESTTRVTFLLLDGSRADFTFCGTCAESLNPGQYTDIWRKALRSFRREMSETAKPWFATQFVNGILAEMGRVKWRELQNG